MDGMRPCYVLTLVVGGKTKGLVGRRTGVNN